MRKRRMLPAVLVGLVAAAGYSDKAIVQPQSVPQPVFDYDELGDLAIIGDYEAISDYSYVGEDRLLAPPVAANDSVMAQPRPGVYTEQPLLDGVVTASCILTDNRTAFLAGNFSRVGSTSAQGFARLDLVTGYASSLGDVDLTGMVKTLWCNGTQVIVGGSLSLDGKGHGVAIWDNPDSQWREAPFGGFAEGSRVNTITPVNTSLVFGGRITGLEQPNASTAVSPSSQLVPLGGAAVSASGAEGAQSTSVPQLLCPNTSSGWQASLDSNTGSVQVDLGLSVELQRIRLYNLPNGTRTWRLITAPSNGIMNLSYSDPNLGSTRYCDAFCPLAPNMTFQDFSFVNDVPTSNLTIELLEFWDSQAGIRGFELFESGHYVYASPEYNFAGCQRGVDSPSDGKTVLQGDWQSSGSGVSQVNVTSIPALSQTTATFEPSNSTQGLYELRMYTPGCLQFGTCNERGAVNVTVRPGQGLPAHSQVLYQTNNDDKYDIIYNGTLGAGSSVEMVPLSPQRLPLNVVAYKIGLTYQGSSQPIAALYQYPDIEEAGNGPINALGRRLGTEAEVQGVAEVNGSLAIGGSDFGNFSSNLVVLGPGGAESVAVSGNISTVFGLPGSAAVVSNNGTYLVRNTTATNITGPVNSVNLFNYNGSDYYAFSRGNDPLLLYDASSDSFVQPRQSIRGRISAYLQANSTFFYFGSLQIADTLSMDGAAMVTSSGVSSLLNTTLSINGTITGGTWLNDSTSLFVGLFNTTVSDGNLAENAVLVDQTRNLTYTVPGLNISQGFIKTIDAVNSTVVFGTSTGLVLWNATTPDNKVQNVDVGWEVDTVSIAPNSSQLIIAGGNGGLGVWNTQQNRWTELENAPIGIRQVTFEAADRLVVAATDQFGTYNTTSQEFTVQSTAPINSTAFVVLANSSYIAAGSNANLSAYSAGAGAQWEDLQAPWQTSTSSVSGLALVPSLRANSTAPLPSDKFLIVTGSLHMQNMNASAMTWDGRTWTPLTAATTRDGQAGTVQMLVSQRIRRLDGGISSARVLRGSQPPGQPGQPQPRGGGSRRRIMSQGRVVGVSCAIAIGCISLIIALYLLATWTIGLVERRQHEGPIRVAYQDVSQAVPPDTLLEQKMR